MSTPYQPMSETEKNAHLTMSNVLGRDGIYASGEAHFFDKSNQNALDTTKPPGLSIFEFNGLTSNFSNATQEYVIDDFNVFNPYRHNTNEYFFSTSQLLELATIKYNIYSQNFRGWF